MYVVVIGGGNVGYYLTKELLAAGHEVVMIEKDPARARTIADELGSIVIPNDGCEGRYQAEAGMARADVVAAVTGDDEDNLVACQVAKMKFNVPRAIARVNNPSNEALFRRLAIDDTVSPTRSILALIEHEIPIHDLLHLAELEGGEVADRRGAARRQLTGDRQGAARPRASRGQLGRGRGPGRARHRRPRRHHPACRRQAAGGHLGRA